MNSITCNDDDLLKFIPENTVQNSPQFDSQSHVKDIASILNNTHHEIHLNRKYRLMTHGYYELSKGQKNLVLEVVGSGQIKIEVKKKGNQSNSLIHNVEKQNGVVVFPIDVDDEQITKIMIFNNKSIQDELNVIMIENDHVVIDLRDKITVTTGLSSKFYVQVKIKDIKDTLQMISRPFYGNIKGDEKFLFYGKIGENKDFSTYDFEGIIFGDNLSVTLSPNQPQFCHSSCTYTLLFKYQQIDYFVFQVMQISNDKIFTLDKSIFYQQNMTEKSDELILKSELPVNVLMKINIFEGIADIKISINNQEIMKDTIENNQTIFMEKKSIQYYGRRNVQIKIELMRKSDQFRYDIEVKQSDNPLLQYDSKLLSLMSPNSRQIYDLDFQQSDHIEQYSVDIVLDSLVSDTDLYLKECMERTCSVSKEDILMAQEDSYQTMYPYQIFKFSQNKNQKQDKVQLNFNCSSLDSFYQYMDNNWPFSKTCKFKIAISGKQQTDKKPSLYKLSIKNKNYSNTIQLNHSHLLQVSPNSSKSLLLELDVFDLKRYQNVAFKFVMVQGDGQIDVKMKNGKKSFNYKNSGKSFMQEDIIIKKYSIQDFTQKDTIMLTINSVSNTVIDIYSALLMKDENLDTEEIEINKIIKRILKRDYSYQKQGKTVYYSNFTIKNIKNLQSSKFLSIQLNSPVNTLNLCISDKDFDKNTNCLLNNSKRVNSLDLSLIKSDNLLISVYLEENESLDMPVNFNLLLSVRDDVVQSQFLTYNELLLSSILNGQKIKYSFNTDDSDKNLMIILNTESPYISLKVYDSEQNKSELSSLNRKNFCFFVSDVGKFKNHISLSKGKFSFYLEVENKSRNVEEFGILLTHNDDPVMIQEGFEVSVPYEYPISVYYKIVGKEIVKLDYQSPLSTQLEVFVKKSLTEDNIKDRYYQSKDSSEETIQVDLSKYSISKTPLILFKFANKKKIHHKLFSTLNEKIKLNLRLKDKKLNPFKSDRQYILKHQFLYYIIQSDTNSQFTVMLNVFNGEADLYINKGIYKYPSIKKYWKKSKHYKGETISISQGDNNSEYYTIGIYARQTSEISIMYAPGLQGLIEIKKQELLRYQIKPNKVYLLNFYSKYSQRLMVYAKKSNIEIDVIDFRDTIGQDILKVANRNDLVLERLMIQQDKYPKMIDIKRRQSQNNHYILKIQSKEKMGQLNVILYSQLLPVKVFAENQMMFALGRHQEIILEIDLHDSPHKYELYFFVNVGILKYYVGEGEMSFSSYKKLRHLRQEYHQLRDFKNKKLYIRIKTKKGCIFDFEVKKKHHFKEINQGSYQIYHSDPNEFTTLYYHLNNNQDQLNMWKEVDSKVKLEIYQASDPHKKSTYKRWDENLIRSYREGIYSAQQINLSDQKGYVVIVLSKTHVKESIRVIVDDQKYILLQNNTINRVYHQKNNIYQVNIPNKGSLYLSTHCRKDYQIKIFKVTQKGRQRVQGMDVLIDNKVYWQNKIMGRYVDQEDLMIRVDIQNFTEFEIQIEGREGEVEIDVYYVDKKSQLMSQYLKMNDLSNRLTYQLQDTFNIDFPRPNLSRKILKLNEKWKYVQFTYQVYSIPFNYDAEKQFKSCPRQEIKMTLIHETQETIKLSKLVKNLKIKNQQVDLRINILDQKMKLFCKVLVSFKPSKYQSFSENRLLNSFKQPLFILDISEVEITQLKKINREKNMVVYLMILVGLMGLIIIVLFVKNRRQKINIVQREDQNVSQVMSEQTLSFREDGIDNEEINIKKINQDNIEKNEVQVN